MLSCPVLHDLERLGSVMGPTAHRADRRLATAGNLFSVGDTLEQFNCLLVCCRCISCPIQKAQGSLKQRKSPEKGYPNTQEHQLPCPNPTQANPPTSPNHAFQMLPASSYKKPSPPQPFPLPCFNPRGEPLQAHPPL